MDNERNRNSLLKELISIMRKDSGKDKAENHQASD